MNPVDLLLTIIVVTVLVTLVLGVGSYVAYKLRAARGPAASEEDAGGPKYFVRYRPPDGPADAEPGAGDRGQG